MSKFLSKKVAVLAALAAVVVAATAYAYLTASGEGTGSGSAAAGAQTVVLTGTTPAIENIGGTATMTIKAKNNSASPVKVGAISVGDITLPTGCPANSFTISTPALSNGGNVPANATAETVATATVTFVNNTTQSQNACTSFDAELTAGAGS